MKYNIGFTLGDPRGDGHACTTDYHIVANHSADEISKAYKETTKLLGFDFIKEVGVDFQSNYWIVEFQRLGGRNFVGLIWSSLWLHISWRIKGYPEK